PLGFEQGYELLEVCGRHGKTISAFKYYCRHYQWGMTGFPGSRGMLKMLYRYMPHMPASPSKTVAEVFRPPPVTEGQPVELFILVGGRFPGEALLHAVLSQGCQSLGVVEEGPGRPADGVEQRCGAVVPVFETGAGER